MKKILIGTVVLSAIGLANVASAADMPLKAPPMVAAPVFTWTGCYIGGNGGGLWARKDWSVTTTRTPFTSQDLSSGIVGGQVGCNYQTGAWVFGIQGDYDWANARASTADVLSLNTFMDNTQIRSLASVTGRVGYAFAGRFLGYVKGGGAWERDNYSTSFVNLTTFGPPGTVFSTASETRPGWTAGVGAEYAITNNLTAFVEYDYYDFGTRTNSFTTIISTTQNTDIRERKSVAKIGLNWLLNWGGPVVAKY
jgi:outer membrane immunogenic protein